MNFLNRIFLLNFLLILITKGEKYVYEFFKLGTIIGDQYANKTIILTTEGYDYNAYQKPQENSFGYSTFMVFDYVPRTYEFLFDQFLIGSNEYLRFVDSTNGDYYKRGNDIIHRGTHAYYQITTKNSTLVFGYDKTLSDDSFNHTGIKLFIREWNPKKYWCVNTNNNHDILIDKEPYFLLSYAYPYSIPTNGSCTFNVNTNSNYLRVFIYDFRLNQNVNEYVKISGQLVNSINADGVDSKLLTGYLTQDLPVTFYYKGNITINVSDLIGQNLSKFFIKITPYNSTDFDNPYNDYCLGTEVNYISKTNPITFGVKSFARGDFYRPNSKCSWKFRDLNDTNLRLLFNFAFESEYGCDYLEMNGFGSNSEDIWQYQGFQSQKFVYATSTSNVSLNWIADGTQNSIGFLGTARLQDCSCTKISSSIRYGDSSTYIYSPGFMDDGIPYCPNVICNWSLNYHMETQYLVVKFIYLDLRPFSLFGKESNTIAMENKFNRTLLMLTANDIMLNRKMYYLSSGNENIQWVSDKNNVFGIKNIKKGFFLEISTRLFPTKFNDRLIQLSKNKQSIYISRTVKNELIKITGTTGSIKIIPQKNFITTDVFVDIFTNNVSSSNLIDNTYFFTSDAYSQKPNGLIINSNIVYIRIYKASIDNNNKVNYNFFISEVGNKDEGIDNPIYQHIFSNQTTVFNISQLIYFNTYNVNTNPSNGFLISTNGSKLNIFGEENNLLSSTDFYPKYYYGDTISLSVENGSQLINLTPITIPYVLTYNFFGDSVTKNIIYSKDYMTSKPENITKMKFVFLNGPRFFNLNFMDNKGAGNIEILVYNEQELYNKKIISNNKENNFVFCGTTIELNYESNLSNFSLLPNELSGFKALFHLSDACKPIKNHSSIVNNNKLFTILICLSWIAYFFY